MHACTSCSIQTSTHLSFLEKCLFGFYIYHVLLTLSVGELLSPVLGHCPLLPALHTFALIHVKMRGGSGRGRGIGRGGSWTRMRTWWGHDGGLTIWWCNNKPPCHRRAKSPDIFWMYVLAQSKLVCQLCYKARHYVYYIIYYMVGIYIYIHAGKQWMADFSSLEMMLSNKLP